MTVLSAASGVLAGFEPRLGARDPAWLAEARVAALQWVGEHGFPTHKDEDWKYTGLAPILAVPFDAATVASGSRVTAEMIDEAAVDLGGPRLVFVNGHFSSEFSRVTGVPAGAVVTTLAAVLAAGPDRLEPFFAHAPGVRHAFAAFNDALAEDGAFIHLPSGTIVDEPIQLVYFSDTGGVPLISSPRSVIIADSDSRATIVETYAGIDSDVYCTNAVTELLLAEDAHIEHYKVQNEPTSAFHVALLSVRQGRGSRFSSRSIMLGASIARHEVRVQLDGVGAEVSLDGVYLPQGDQLHDNTIFVDHAATDCTSHQLYKGVLDGRAHGVFNGHIMVRHGADGTDANQKNKNLLLSDRAEVDTRPRLEIYTDDVKCTHGAAVGQMDEEALLYLQTRAIPLEAARGLLIYAFVHEMVDRIELDLLRAQLERVVATRFGSDATVVAP
ncbi:MULTISPECIES: Fe-S cluster assembly protein SufD [Cryobacterium]|uniref:Fe-S cluster assembly protein SufD n=1 Tax=Cryobacterium levicorallinum TaxID=995038 RepID=A0ABY1EDD6_9MICO|nr:MULTISPECIES: Fe-S cluster assembly protein SufD [Cryobacterium]GEP26523.1 Fe-S cluster assembly protein SufD [Cryobacterium levicorallinum]SFH49866.1 Fe-S cluster assembly protein SufD [Cryobacterium levicorallinum]